MLLLLALGVPQRPLAALEADLADFEAVLERGGKEPPEPIYASVDVRICSAIPKLERTFAHCKFVAEHRIEWLRCFEETVEKMAWDAAPETAHALCIKQHATKAEPEPECCENDPPTCADDKKWWIHQQINKVGQKVASKTTELLWGTTDDAVANPKQRERLLLSKLQVSPPPPSLPPPPPPLPPPPPPPQPSQPPPSPLLTHLLRAQGIMLLSDGNSGDADTEQDDKKVYTAFRMMSGTFQPDTTGFFKKVLAGALGTGTKKAGNVGGTGRGKFALASATTACIYGVAKSVLKGEPEDDGVDGENNLERIAESAELERIASTAELHAVARKQPLEATERLLARAERTRPRHKLLMGPGPS